MIGKESKGGRREVRREGVPVSTASTGEAERETPPKDSPETCRSPPSPHGAPGNTTIPGKYKTGVSLLHPSLNYFSKYHGNFS